MKHNLILMALIVVSLASCNNSNSSLEDSNNSNSTNIENSSEENESSLLDSSSSANSSSEIEESQDDGMILNNSLISKNEVDIGINEYYSVDYICKDKNVLPSQLIPEDKKIAFCDVDNNIFGISVGQTSFKVVFYLDDGIFYSMLKVNVKDDINMNGNFSTEGARIANKTFTILGDSISDVSVTAYPNDRPTFWCEMLRDRYNMTMYDYAISGSCAGFCQKQADSVSYDLATSICGTNVINKENVKESIKNSDYVFIYFGNNDVTFDTNIGNYDDVNDENYKNIESFKGAYSYIIKKAKEYNPNIKIVCLSLSFSTWGIGKTTRRELANIVGEIANDHDVKFINIFDLWDNSNFSTFAPDGIHPQTSGYELIVEKILES